MNTISELLDLWRETHDEMLLASDETRNVIADLQYRIDVQGDIVQREEQPLRDKLTEIEAELKPMIIAHAATFKGNGVTAAFRKGAKRVTYKWQTVDAVRDVLRDVLPETATSLDGARKESIGKPSVTVKRVDA